MMTGHRDNYFWIEYDGFLSDLDDYFKECLPDSCAIITSLDSGVPKASAHEIVHGWRNGKSGMVHNQISQAGDFPTAGFDEWWIFDKGEVVEFIEIRKIYVNYSPWHLRPTNELLADLQEEFWLDCQTYCPTIYACDGISGCIIVTKNENIFRGIKKREANKRCR